MFLLFFQINFRLNCSYFVLVTIIDFDLAIENGWFEGKMLYFNTQTGEYYILFTDGTTYYVAAEDFDGIDLIYCKVSSELVHSVHSLLICVSSFN